MNLANLLTLLRLLLAPFVLRAIVNQRPAGSGTVRRRRRDRRSGRRRGAAQEPGHGDRRLFRPDRRQNLLTSVFLALAASGTIPWWLAGIVLGRDLYILLAGGVLLPFTSPEIPARAFGANSPPSCRSLRWRSGWAGIGWKFLFWGSGNGNDMDLRRLHDLERPPLHLAGHSGCTGSLTGVALGSSLKIDGNRDDSLHGRKTLSLVWYRRGRGGWFLSLARPDQLAAGVYSGRPFCADRRSAGRDGVSPERQRNSHALRGGGEIAVDHQLGIFRGRLVPVPVIDINPGIVDKDIEAPTEVDPIVGQPEPLLRCSPAGFDIGSDRVGATADFPLRFSRHQYQSLVGGGACGYVGEGEHFPGFRACSGSGEAEPVGNADRPHIHRPSW